MRRIIKLDEVDGVRGLAPREARIARKNMPIPDGTRASRVSATATAIIWEGRVVESDMGYDVMTGGLVLPVSGDEPMSDLVGIYGLPEPTRRKKLTRRWGDPRQLYDDFVW